MNRISPKRKATAKLHYNSTFAAKTPAKKPAEKPAKVKAVKTRGYWKRQADKWFSEFIRLRDAGPDGRVKCITCSHTNHWRQLQNGHWITRGHDTTRYDELNCNTQCRGCNYNGGQHLEHAAAIEAKHGPGTCERLERKAKMSSKRTLSDYKFLADTYKARVMRIKEREPGRYSHGK
jgi:hypothetical protein